MTTIEPNLLGIILQETAARLVLADFREAMVNPVDTGFFCYRAIEAMMQSMKANSNERASPSLLGFLSSWLRSVEFLGRQILPAFSVQNATALQDDYFIEKKLRIDATPSPKQVLSRAELRSHRLQNEPPAN